MPVPMPVVPTGVKTVCLGDDTPMSPLGLVFLRHRFAASALTLVALAFAVATFTFSAATATAATMTVNTTLDAHDDNPGDDKCQAEPGGPCSLRAALEQAQGNGNAEPDLITLPAGDFRLTLGTLFITSAGMVKITGAGPELTTIRQTGPDRVFMVYPPGAIPTFYGMTIRGGRLPADSGTPFGGGIYSVLGIRLDQVVLYDNKVVGTSTSGSPGAGALYVTGDEVRIERTRIARNEAPIVGGADIQTPNLLIADSAIEQNTGFTGVGGMSMLVTSGAGNQGRILNTSIVGNRAPEGHPGGLSGGGSTAAPMPAFTIENSLVAGNVAGGGGGGWVLGGLRQAEVYNSTFSGNVSSGSGSASAILKQFGSGPPVLLRNVTLTGDSGEEAPPLLRHQGGDAFSLIGTLVDGACSSTSGTTADSSTLFRDASCGGTPAGSLGLGPLADNGGPTLTHALLPGSPALDGMPSGCSPIDQRHAPRSVAPCDVGAFEHGATAPLTPEGPPAAPDVDGDGIEDLDDACPDRAGEKADGCPADPAPGGNGTDGQPNGGDGGPTPPSGPNRIAVFNLDRVLLKAGRIEVSGRLTPATGGKVGVIVRGPGRRTARFNAKADPQRFRLRKRLPRSMRRARSLKVTLHHSGTGSIAPARATLLAGQRQARLRVGKVRLNRGKGQLRIRGRISPRIPGKLALKLLPTDAGQGKAIQLKAKIKRGRWQLTRRLPGLGPEHRRLVIAYRGNAARSVAGTQFVRGL